MHPDIFIETEKLLLRQWKKEDEKIFIEMNKDPEVMEFFPAMLTEEQSIALIEKNKKRIESEGYGLFAVERKDNKSFIGFTGFSHPGFDLPFTPCFEIGWRIRREDWNQGFATEAAHACIEFGFQKLSLKDIYSFTSVHNTRSENVMKKINLVKQGIFDHPLLEDGHYLQSHILYKISND